MESRNARARSSLWLAFSTSLLLHAAVLFVGFSASDQPAGSSSAGDATHPRLLAALATPNMPSAPQPTPRRSAAPATRKTPAAPPKPAERRALSVPSGAWEKRTWSTAERAQMNQFLDELAAEARPPSGRELAASALAMARRMPTQGTGSDDGEAPQTSGQGVEPYSLAMYFDAFVRKMNRSAAFVANDRTRRPGSHKALVEIALNADGSLKSYRVLRSGDQAAEIAYIKSVIDRAAPFSAFPRDIRRASDSLSILMCILPAHAGGGGGFSRSSGADCRD